MKHFISFLLLALFISVVKAQDTSLVATKEALGELKGAVDGINETMLEMKSTIDALKKIKVSGYIQSQFQATDGSGGWNNTATSGQNSVGNFSGGSFPKDVASRFSVRRGRFKINYDNDLTQYVLEVDVTQNGVGIKDAYAWIIEPWMRTFALTAGIFYRPFGFEVLHSHSVIESPEFARAIQTLFPGERDLGAQLEVAQENGPLSYFNLKAGLFNGVLNTANENDNNKDFIGRLGFQLPLEEQSLAIDGGISFYLGKVRSNSKFIYTTDASAKTFMIDSTISNAGAYFDRSYLGVDLQLYYDLPVLGGLSLRGEYITGKQPGTSTSNSFYNPGATVTPLYQRNSTGWYIDCIQNIGLKNQLVVKYDVFDPNTDVEGSDIGAAGSNLTVADIKYSTLGIGWIYHWDANVKFTFYYDIVTNEKVNSAATGSLAPFTDDVKDNVLTVRIQYKF